MYTFQSILFKNNRSGKGKFYFSYTILFIIMTSIVFSSFYFNQNSFVWKTDGVTQHVPALTYWGTLLRQVIKNIFINHTFQIPMWDLNIGYGSDILTTLHYYVIGDPLNLFAVLIPADKTEYLYCALVILRLYFAGIAFSLYCRRFKKNNFAILVGAIIYIYSGYAMFVAVRHPYFINPMIYLPILLIGVEKILKKEKPYLFIIAVAISAFSNFYFFYMLALLIFIYTIFRYIMIFKKIRIKELFKWIYKFCMYFLIGSCIAMIVLLPNAMLLFGSSRYATETAVPLYYIKDYYYKAFIGFISANQPSYYTKLGFSSVALVSIFILFIQNKKKLSLKIGLVLTTMFYLVPFFGYMFNGFSSVQNRWIWGYAMLVAFISVEMIPYFIRIKKDEKIKLSILTLVYMILYLILSSKTSVSIQKNLLVSIVILGITTIFLISLGKLIKSNRAFQFILIFITCLGIGTNSYFNFSKEQGDYVSEFEKVGSVYSKLTTTPSSLLDELKDESAYRYDRDNKNGEIVNSSLLQNTNSVGYRFSMADGNISQFYEELYLNVPRDYYYKTLDNRTVLELLASVKYFMIKDGRTNDLPYGYDKLITSKEINGSSCEVYTSDNYLPFGYTYTKYIPREEYDLLSATEKQWALLQGVVLEDDIGLEKAKLSFSDKEIDYNIIPDENVHWNGNKIITTKANATVSSNFQGLENSETYLIISNLNVLSKKNKDVYTIKVSSNDQAESIQLVSKQERSYCGRNSFLCNLNYNDKACTKITLTFPIVGEYCFDDLSVVCQSMNGIDEAAQTLKEDVLENLEITTNHISGTINLEKSKLLLLSIPYSEGWTAYVDGKEQKILKSNSMFSGLLLKEGEHKIDLAYQTPYLKVSAIISFLGFLSLLCVFLYEKKNNHNNT